MSKVLTIETIPSYLMENYATTLQALLPPRSAPLTATSIRATTITGGNMNYAFFVQLQAETTVFLKQAPEYVAIFGPDGYPVTSERMQREMDVYSEWESILKDQKFLPKIYFFDPKHMTVAMEFLEGFELLDHVLVAPSPSADMLKNAATELGTFMGATHAATHATKVTTERREYLTKHFENRPMRDIQLEFVFTKCYKEATDEQRAGLNVNEAFLAEIELLKKQYNGDSTHDNLVLCHGDLHPGSVMVHPTHGTRVIDPEFTVYGPPGLDVGSLLSGLVLGAVHQIFADPETSASAQEICKCVDVVWNAYLEAFRKGGVTDETILRQTEAETVGFTVAEVCRTALEFAGGRKWLQFENPETKAASIKAALNIVNTCMIDRHEGGMNLLLDSLRKVIEAARAG